MDTVTISLYDLQELYNLAQDTGQIFRYCRVGESHPKATEMREELLKPYNKLAYKIDDICRQAGIKVY